MISILLILTGAFVLRFASPGSIGLDHFDEGIYASAGDQLFAMGAAAKIDPRVIPYGPPVTPILIGVCETLLGGPSDFAAVVPGLVFGTFAVWLTWRFGRSALSAEAGLCAAILLAASGMAIAFSRSALTEGPFMAVWLLAMISGASFLKRPSPLRAIALGATVGLAQLTKYNGGLTGVIVAVTAVADFVIVKHGSPRNGNLLARRIFWGVVAAGIALLLYAPWFLFVENNGGYRALLRHHGGYVTGIERWPSQLRLQLAQAWRFQNQPVLMVVSPLALAFLLSIRDRNDRQPRRMALPIVAAIAFACLPNAAWIFALLAIPGVWRSGDVSGRLVVIWLVVMSLVTPLYHPYARLWLPTHLASLLIVGWIMTDSGATLSGATSGDRWSLAKLHMPIIGLAATVAIGLWSVPAASLMNRGAWPSVWSGRTVMRDEIVGRIVDIRDATARGQTVWLLLSPTGRRALQNAMPVSAIGPGRLAVLADLTGWRPGAGPLLVDMATLTDIDRQRLLDDDLVPRETLKVGFDLATGHQAHRGLITILDQAPGAARGEPIPELGVHWIER
jgi:4-amino-4-deoxy-L-arabinose transferase-like glycosyltransferase